MQPPTPPARRPLPPMPPRPAQTGVAPRPGHSAAARTRPNPTSHRLAIGFGGLAAASALATAFLAPATPAAPPSTTIVTADAIPIQHVTQYVQLRPGQTPSPNATVTQAAPAPTPRVVVVTTRQSGTKR
jgi:hypothetical protein